MPASPIRASARADSLFIAIGEFAAWTLVVIAVILDAMYTRLLIYHVLHAALFIAAVLCAFPTNPSILTSSLILFVVAALCLLVDIIQLATTFGAFFTCVFFTDACPPEVSSIQYAAYLILCIVLVALGVAGLTAALKFSGAAMQAQRRRARNAA